jgi:hypothetical protein
MRLKGPGGISAVTDALASTRMRNSRASMLDG